MRKNICLVGCVFMLIVLHFQSMVNKAAATAKPHKYPRSRIKVPTCEYWLVDAWSRIIIQLNHVCVIRELHAFPMENAFFPFSKNICYSTQMKWNSRLFSPMEIEVWKNWKSVKCIWREKKVRDWFAALNDMSLETCTVTINSHRYCGGCFFLYAEKSVRVTKSFCNNFEEKITFHIHLCSVHTNTHTHFSIVGTLAHCKYWRRMEEKRAKEKEENEQTENRYNEYKRHTFTNSISMKMHLFSSQMKYRANNKDPTKQFQQMIAISCSTVIKSL